jgi:hypothetical protein
MKGLRLLTMLLFVARVLPAQSPAPLAPPKPTGTVNGHVILGDTHLPARMASVSLISAKPTQPTSADST